MEPIGAKPDNPVWMAIIPRRPSIKEFLFVTAITVVPVAIGVLMQKPALRQAIYMNACHTTKEVSQHIADFFQIIATGAAQEYQKAKL